MDYYDYDPADPGRDAERARVAQGLKDLYDALNAPILAAKAAAVARQREMLKGADAVSMGDPRPTCVRLKQPHCHVKCRNIKCPAYETVLDDREELPVG